MKTCHNTNIIVQTTDGYVYSLNGKSKIPNNILANITRPLLLKSNYNKELWWFFIDLMSRIGVFYKTCLIETQTVAPTLPVFQGIK